MFFFPSYEAAFPSASSSSTLACSKACFLGLRTVWYLEKKRTIVIFNYSDAHKSVSALISGLLFWYPGFCMILELARRHSSDI